MRMSWPNCAFAGGRGPPYNTNHNTQGAARRNSPACVSWRSFQAPPSHNIFKLINLFAVPSRVALCYAAVVHDSDDNSANCSRTAAAAADSGNNAAAQAGAAANAVRREQRANSATRATPSASPTLIFPSVPRFWSPAMLFKGRVHV